MKRKLIPLTETAIFVALAIVLNFISNYFSFHMPQGGSITLGLIPIVIIGFRHGTLYGVVGGFIYAFFDLLFYGEVTHLGSLFFDYFIACGVLGLTGLVFKWRKNIFVYGGAIFAVCFLKFLSHFLSGVLFFAEYAHDDGYYGLGVLVYSFIYNITYLGPTTLITIVACLALFPVVIILLPSPKKK